MANTEETNEPKAGGQSAGDATRQAAIKRLQATGSILPKAKA